MSTNEHHQLKEWEKLLEPQQLETTKSPLSHSLNPWYGITLN
jgi:hypothetical protein